jgi:hypothetical protein
MRILGECGLPLGSPNRPRRRRRPPHEHLEDLAGSEEVVKIQILKFFARICDGVHVAPKKAPGFLGYSSSWLGDGVAKDKGKKQEAGVSLVTRETDEGGSRTKDDDDEEEEEEEEEDWRNLSGAAH